MAPPYPDWRHFLITGYVKQDIVALIPCEYWVETGCASWRHFLVFVILHICKSTLQCTIPIKQGSQMILQPKKLPKVPISQPFLLPETSGLYLVVDGANRVWYVGQSSNIRARHQNHSHAEEFKKHRCIYVCPFAWEDADDLDYWEKENINHYKSPINQYLHDKSSIDLPIIDLGYDSSNYINRYVEIKQMLSDLTTELEQLKPNIISILEQHPEGKIKTDFATGWVSKRAKWQYSQEVETLKQSVKDTQKLEEKTGVATLIGYSIFPVVRCNTLR